jgi:hypothetical protein
MYLRTIPVHSSDGVVEPEVVGLERACRFEPERILRQGIWDGSAVGKPIFLTRPEQNR